MSLKVFESLVKKLEKLETLISMTGKPEIEAMAKFLYERISHPDSYVVFLGETSSGKSSIINGLLGASVLPMKANPTTAAITEIELCDNVAVDEYYAINKNATIEKITYELFMQLSEHPDENLKRLKVRRNSKGNQLNNLRIFDTPGYGSIVTEHEEVLKDFLPNSDIIIYTVNYKIGIQDEDFIFLGFLRELIRPDVKIYLLVNRCPQEVDARSPKIEKIASFVSDILTVDPTVYIIPNMVTTEGQGHPLPHCKTLWNSVAQVLGSPSRVISLTRAFEIYICDLYNECFRVIKSRYLSSKMSKLEFERIKSIQEESAQRILHAIPNFVIPVFEKIENTLPCKFKEARNNVQKRLEERIDSSDRTGMEEMVAYMNSHLLPHTIKVETGEIEHYIDTELSDLNSKVDDYLQKELVHFNNEISIQLQTNVETAASSILATILKRVGKNSLEGYFFAFGGMGGANAGIANATSHLLKKAGDLFGHTFSRTTHNGVKHFLSRIGATSMKSVGAAVAVVAELMFSAYELAVWKNRLRNKVSKGLDKWQKETCMVVIKDLAKLREENVDTIRIIAGDIAHTFDEGMADDSDECFEQYNYAKKIAQEIGLE